MKKLALTFVVALIAFACKNEAKHSEIQETINSKLIETSPELIVSIDFKTNKVDEFRLLLNNIKVDEFQKKNIQIIEKVSPSSSTDNIIAKFGENNISKLFLIVLGTKELKEVIIENIRLSYGKNNINIKPSELEKYFNFNKFIEFDSASNKILTKKVEGKHNPVLQLKPFALKKLEESSDISK
ncbi:hypothetical protein ACFSSB_11245 [Lacinutrix gracilariae]|uniref:Lipoprotein n=1 Tax=Lacinutrix gracilariae TaxID=1747198 RepID=A0ABW5K3W3_9FLAO